MIFRNDRIEAGITKDPISREAFIYLKLPAKRHVSFHASWINGKVAEQVEREGLRCR